MSKAKQKGATEELRWMRQSRFNRKTVSYVGADVILIGDGTAIEFINITTGLETVYRVTNPYSGVACVCGHAELLIFAFAEESNDSRVVVMSYPDFREICVLSTDANAESKFSNKPPYPIRRICSIVFSDVEHLVVLTGFPDYVLEVWNWRTQKLLGSQPTDIQTDVQFLKIARSMPLALIQLSYNLGKANYWELFPSTDSVSIIRRPLEIPGGTLYIGPFGATHQPDGSIIVTNSTLNLWQIYPQTQKVTLIYDNLLKEQLTQQKRQLGCVGSVLSDDGSEASLAARLPDVEEDLTHKRLFLHSYRGKVALTDSQGILRMYKKSTPQWTELYRVHSDHSFLVLSLQRYPDQPVLAGITNEGTIVVLDDNNVDPGSWRVLKRFHRMFKFIEIMQPMGDIVVAITDLNDVLAMRMDTSEQLDSVAIPLSHVTCASSSSTLPILILGNDLGIVYLFSMYDATNLQLITTFHLSNFGIGETRINRHSNCIVAVDQSNAVFVLQGQLGEQMSVTHHIQLSQHPLRVTINVSPSDEVTLTTLLSPIVAPNRRHSDHVLQIQVESNNAYNLVEGVLPRTYASLRRLWQEEDTNDQNVFLAVPYLSTNFEIVRLKQHREGNRMELRMEVLETCETSHRLNSIDVTAYDDFVLTWSIDGMVQIYAKSTWTLLCKFQVFDIWAKGVKKAVTNHTRQWILSLGNHGSLQCFYHPHAIDNSKIFKLRKILQSYEVREMFNRPTIGFEPTGEDSVKSWVQIKLEKFKEQERQSFADDRQQCWDDLDKLKAKLKELIDANEVAPEDEQLAIEEFDLDDEGTTFKKLSADEHRAEHQASINRECTLFSELTDTILSKTWAQMSVKGRNIRGIFTKLKVENYSLVHVAPAKEQQMQRAQMWRNTEELIAIGDTFKPWVPKSHDTLIAQLNRKAGYEEVKDNTSLTAHSSTESVGAVSKNRFALSGTSSHAFIKPTPIRYDQMDVVSYIQMVQENIFGYKDILALRQYFNTKFDEMSSVKDSELQLARQRNERLRHIQSELNKLEELKDSGIFHEREITDPAYSPDELPESIVKVEPHELPITPYISPSEQDLLDAAAAEAERRRLALLADDFRDRALMKMMNGVLEIRWEDEIKKIPPEPECMRLGKDPKDYTPEDLGAIFAYEALVEHLNSERERYRVMLFAEEEKIDHTLEEQIKKFNLKVGATLMEKIKVEFAITTEDLKLLRNRQFNYHRMFLAKRERDISARVQEIQRDTIHLTEVLNQQDERLVMLKNRYEDLMQKDRLLERHFKSSFGEFGNKAVVDQAFRVFRRRPKWQMRAWHTAAILTDMARRTVSADSSKTGAPLPEECYTFLQQVDQLDKMSNAPNLMDANTWQILCKMRRVKLEVEFRVRSVGVQIADTESTFNAFAREINSKKNRVANLNQREADTNHKRIDDAAIRTVQICIKRGLVEIPLSGHICDFASAILLHSSDVHDINHIIKKAGEKKLKTMENAAIFRRKITMKEWEHEVLRMRIEEKQQQIKCIQKTKITKEIQLWLRYKQNGWKDDISDHALNRDIESNRKSLEFMCNEIISSINDTNDQIEEKKRMNTRLDAQIQAVNLDVTELNLARDLEREKRLSDEREQRLKMMMQRSQLVRDIQLNHAKILELCTVLELQRLRTFPTLTLSGLQDNDNVDEP